MKQLSRERLEALASGDAFTCVQDDEATLMAQMLLAGMAQEPIHQLFAPGPGGSSWIDVGDEEEVIRLRSLGATIRTLFAAPPAQVVPEPVSNRDELPAGIPDRIWLNTAGEWPADGTEGEVTWCRDQQHDLDTLYVRADAWIPCGERMPEPNIYVLVSNGVWVGQGLYNDAIHLEEDERWQDEHQEFIDLLHFPVTHWQPLPALPQR